MSDSTFTGLPISSPILKAIDSLGFEAPTPIQQQAIPPLMEGRDVVGQAQTGTGKTAAFGIPLLQHIDTSVHGVQAIILCPTRELAIQVTGELIKLGRFMEGLQVIPVYGGQPIGRQIKALKRGAQVVVGTPGRIIDHLQRKTMTFGGLKQVVFDEADEMLNMGFRDDMERILSYADGSLQMIMFSATVSGQIRQIMSRYMTDPVTIRTGREEIAAPGIEQYVVEIRDSVRTEAIGRLMDIRDFKLGLVFCNTKRKTEKLSRELKARGYAADYINGDLSQNQRERVMDRFRSGRLDMLVATDVAARGIDVDDIDVVFNYDIPHDTEYYVHRIGRTGRAGRTGVAITFCSGNKKKQLRAIEKMVGQKLTTMNMPSPAEVKSYRTEGFFERVTEILEKGDLREYIDQIEKHSDQRFSAMELAAALLKMQTSGAPKETPAGRPSNGAVEGVVQVRINAGKKHNIYPGDILGAITGETSVPGQAVGNIDIRGGESYVDIPGTYVEELLSGMGRSQIKGRKVRISRNGH